jgi:hypothetical protein
MIRRLDTHGHIDAKAEERWLRIFSKGDGVLDADDYISGKDRTQSAKDNFTADDFANNLKQYEVFAWFLMKIRRKPPGLFFKRMTFFNM